MDARDTCEIHRIGPTDLEDMRALLTLFAEEFDDVDSYLGAPPADDYLRGILESGSLVVLAARVGGKVVGGLAAYELRKFEQERSEFYIYDLAVARPFRRRGVATSLIDALKPVASARGAWTIFVQADLDDGPALALYSGLGRREDVVHFDIPVG